MIQYGKLKENVKHFTKIQKKDCLEIIKFLIIKKGYYTNF